MPEGDSIWRLSQRLQPLVGRRIISSDFRVPQLATLDLAGKKIDRVWAIGKHLLWACSDLALHTHLRMDGTWQIHRVGARWSLPEHTARVVFQVTGDVELVGHDLGLVEVWPLDELDNRLGHLGPDLLSEHWDGATRWQPSGRAEAIARICAQPNRSFGEALLDQRNLAGIGNEYRAELCFLLGLHPRTPVRNVQVAKALELATKLMRGNLDSPVRTFTGDHRRGHTTFVFGRAGRPCLRCGAPIAKSVLGETRSITDAAAGQERIIWWCPNCQPESAASDSAS